MIKYNISNSQKITSNPDSNLDSKIKTGDYNGIKSISNSGMVTIEQILSHVFRRPYLTILPETSFIELGTFLATGYQVYVDGLIVAVDKKLVGRLSGKHVLDHILRMNYQEWSRVKASDLMDDSTSSIEMDSTLNSLFQLFEETRFALAPITKKGVLIGSIGIRDLLPLIVDMNLDTPVRTIGSPIVSLSREGTLKNAIELMLKKNIRNLVVPSNTNDNYYILTDRKILEFIFSCNGRKIMGQGDGDGASALNMVGLDSLDMMSVVTIPNETTISKVAAMLADINTPGLVFKNNIVTPWDVITKTRHSRYA